MSRNIGSRRGGFTIIEVVLVLAIAGLIMMMVFVAMPSLRFAQSNKQIYRDLGRFMSAVTDYQANHDGMTPWAYMRFDFDQSNTPNFINRYIDPEATFVNNMDRWVVDCSDALRKPDGNCYSFSPSSTFEKFSQDFKEGDNETIYRWHLNADRVHALVGWKCGESEDEATFTGKRYSLALVYFAKKGSRTVADDWKDGAVAMCVDNS